MVYSSCIWGVIFRNEQIRKEVCNIGLILHRHNTGMVCLCIEIIIYKQNEYSMGYSNGSSISVMDETGYKEQSGRKRVKRDDGL